MGIAEILIFLEKTAKTVDDLVGGRQPTREECCYVLQEAIKRLNEARLSCMLDELNEESGVLLIACESLELFVPTAEVYYPKPIPLDEIKIAFLRSLLYKQLVLLLYRRFRLQ